VWAMSVRTSLMSFSERGRSALTATIAAPTSGGHFSDVSVLYRKTLPRPRGVDEASGKKGAAIYQLLDMILLRKINARKDIQQFKTEVEDRVKTLYSSENLVELPQLGVSIPQTLEKFAPGSQLRLKWDVVKPPEVQLPMARATLVEDDFEGEISRKGHGLQRALIVTLLQHLAMTIPVEPPVAETEEAASKQAQDTDQAVRGPDLILAIEEPELYLHPSRCHYLSDLLFSLAVGSGVGLAARNQIIYATHSPYFVDLFRFNKIRMVRKVFSPNSPVAQASIEAFTLGQAAKELAQVCDVDPVRFTEDSFREERERYLEYCIAQGYTHSTLSLIARELLWIARKLHVDPHRTTLKQVRAAAHGWAERERRCGHALNTRWTRNRFAQVAQSWLRFLELLVRARTALPF